MRKNGSKVANRVDVNFLLPRFLTIIMDALPSSIPKSIAEALNRLEIDEEPQLSQDTLPLILSCKLRAKTSINVSHYRQ